MGTVADMPALSVVTKSYPKPLPEWLKEYQAKEAAKKSGTALAGLGDKKPKRAVVNEECPKCVLR